MHACMHASNSRVKPTTCLRWDHDENAARRLVPGSAAPLTSTVAAAWPAFSLAVRRRQPTKHAVLRTGLTSLIQTLLLCSAHKGMGQRRLFVTESFTAVSLASAAVDSFFPCFSFPPRELCQTTDATDCMIKRFLPPLCFVCSLSPDPCRGIRPSADLYSVLGVVLAPEPHFNTFECRAPRTVK